MEEPTIIHTPFGSTIDKYTLSDARLISSLSGGPTVTYPPATWASTNTNGTVTLHMHDYRNQVKGITSTQPLIWDKIGAEHMVEYEKKGKKLIHEKHPGQESVICEGNTVRLSEKQVLTTLAVMKRMLQFSVKDKSVQKLICTMTPKVRKNIMVAARKSKMFGKDLPIIPAFDEDFNPLPDRMNIGTLPGVDVEIIPESSKNNNYLELTAILFEDIEIPF